MKSTRVTLVCHARTDAQRLARFALDESVEMDWQAAAGSMAERFKSVFTLLSAPEARTRETAALFGSTVEIVDALADCNLGRWHGLDLKDLQRDEPEALHVWLDDPSSAPHGAESVAQMHARVGHWLDAVRSHGGHIVAVTHPFVIRAALLHAVQCPLAGFNGIDVEPLSTVDLRFNGRWRLRLTPNG